MTLPVVALGQASDSVLTLASIDELPSGENLVHAPIGSPRSGISLSGPPLPTSLGLTETSHVDFGNYNHYLMKVSIGVKSSVLGSFVGFFSRLKIKDKDTEILQTGWQQAAY